MIRVRKSEDRGHFDHGWLRTYHTFSFSGYYDPQQMGFRALRVINEDWIDPGQGFGTHGHENMEIVTYVLEGGIAHRDSLGSGDTLHPGELQKMTAGTGIRHSEFNPSPTEPVHLYQIWLLPEGEGFEPAYEQRAFPVSERQNRLRLVASPDGADGSLTIRQNARLFLGSLDQGREETYSLANNRHAWVQALTGTVEINGQALSAGDGAAVSDEAVVAIRATSRSEVLLFDLA